MILSWIDQQAALDDLLAIISEARAITLDTEFVRVSTFHPKPGLIQVGLNSKAFLIDPLVGLNFNQLGDLLRGGTKSILHAAQEDYEVLFRLTGQLPALVFDTQVAYALLNPTISPVCLLLRQSYWVRRFLNKKLAQTGRVVLCQKRSVNTLRMMC